MRGVDCAVSALIVLSTLSLCFTEEIDDSKTAKAFSSLSGYDLKTHWSRDDGSSIEEKIRELQDFEDTVMVDVKLVGFDGDGNLGIAVDPDAFLHYLEELSPRRRAYAIAPQHTDKNGAPSHDLNIKHRVIYRVTKANPSLHRGVAATVERLAAADTLGRVPVEAVDSLVRADYRGAGVSYTLYLINTRLQTPLDYTYTPPPPPTPSNPPPKGAGGGMQPDTNMWIGADSLDDRYAWLDLTAGRAEYGPSLGRGLVMPSSLPQPTIQLSQAFLSQLSAIVSRSVALLVLPPVHFFPLPSLSPPPTPSSSSSSSSSSDRVLVTIITMHDGRRPPAPRWPELRRRIQEFGLRGQEVVVKSHSISFDACELCAAALALSRRSHTSTFVQGGGGKAHQYLDSVEAHDWLTQFDDDFWGLSQGWRWRVVPVFVFALDTPSLVLLDREYQSVAFPDMVVAVQTRGRYGTRSANWDGEEASFYPGDPAKSIFGSLLNTVWGVASIDGFWNPREEAVEPDYLWTLPPSPFDPFSDSMTPTWVQADAAARAAVHTHIHTTLREVRLLLNHFSRYNLEPEECLTPPAHLEFVRRWNFIRHKLERSSNYLSLHNFDRAVTFVTAAEEDVTALHKLVHAASASLHPIRDCTTPLPLTPTSSSSTAAAATASKKAGETAGEEGGVMYDPKKHGSAAFLVLGGAGVMALLALCLFFSFHWGGDGTGVGVGGGGSLRATARWSRSKPSRWRD